MTKARTLADNFAADISGITAGTGITGGGTSGTVTVTNSMATEIDAKGDLVVGTGADTFSRLAVASTAGYLLSVDSGETTGLKWAAPAGGGKVLQVVSLELTSGNFTTSSSSFVDVTGLTLAITPAAATSKIMMFLTTTSVGTSTSGGANVDMRFALVRTSTILTEARFDLENNTGSTTLLGMPVTLTYLDSPNTTSATTYKLQVKKVNFSDTITVQANATNKAMLTLMEIGA